MYCLSKKKKRKEKKKKGSQKKTHALFYSDSPVCVLFFFVFCFLPHREKCFDYFFVSLSRSEGPFEAFDSVVSLLFLSSRARVCVCVLLLTWTFFVLLEFSFLFLWFLFSFLVDSSLTGRGRAPPRSFRFSSIHFQLSPLRARSTR